MKIYRKIFSFFLVFALLSTWTATVFATDGDGTVSFNDVPIHTVNATAAMLIELTSGEILVEQNADGLIYPASLTKIMTCMLALENGKLSDEITVSQTAIDNIDPSGSSAGLLVGEILTLEELLYCVMISSANEACDVVAEYVAGTTDDFVDLMNRRAQELGCTSTSFANTHGLHDENHYTTARDLSIIAQAALEIPMFQTICHTTEYTVPSTNLSGPRELLTTNYLTSTATNSGYYYELAQGVKTGFTTPAGRCLISTADNGSIELLSIVCGAETVVLDSGDLLLENFTETKALFEYGFEHFTYAPVLDGLYPIAQVDVLYSNGAPVSVLAPAESISALLPSSFDPSLVENDVTLSSPNGIEAPVEKGEVLGTVTVVYDGTDLGTTDLIAITDIGRSEIKSQVESTKVAVENYWLPILLGLLVLSIAVVIGLLILRRHIIVSRRKKQRERERQVLQFPQDSQD